LHRLKIKLLRPIKKHFIFLPPENRLAKTGRSRHSSGAILT